MTGKIQNLFHYPIKGLSAQSLDVVELHPGQGFPMDRAFGFARPDSGFDPKNPTPLPKTKFVVLARDAGLARLATHYDPADQTLSILVDGSSVTFGIDDQVGRDGAAEFIADHLAYLSEDRPTLYSAAPHRFTDVSVVSPAMMNAISLINLDSVAALSSEIGAQVDAARFRGNIIFSGIPAFAELDWINREIVIGKVRLSIVKRTKRCPATEVNLQTAQRDLNIPKLLRNHYGHSDMGVYAEVITGGQINPGDRLTLL